MISATRRALGISCFSILALAACRDASGPDEGDQPALIEAVSSISLTGTVDAEVANLPTVVVKNAAGSPVANVRVTFVLIGASGTISGNSTFTRKDGIAQLGGWKLSTRSGVHTVIATIPFIESVRFEVVASPGPALHLDIVAGDNQAAQALSALLIPPTVQAIDEFGNGVPGVPVEFSVTGGGGILLRPSTLTDSSGRADAGTWLLGAAGPQSIVATSGNLVPARFIATATTGIDNCGEVTPITGSPVQSTFDSHSCVNADGRYFAWYSVKISETRSWWFVMRASDARLDPLLELRDSAGNLVALNDNRDDSPDAIIQVSLTPGLYKLVATSSFPNMPGKYGLAYYEAPGEPKGCDGMFVVKGIAISTALHTGSCERSSQRPAGIYRIHLRAGEILLTSLRDRSYSGPDFEIASESGQKFAKGEATGPYERRLSFTAPATAVYVVNVYSIYDDEFDYSIEFH